MMRFAMIIMLFFWMLCMQISAQDCVPATGEPVTLGAVFPQQSLLLGGSNNAYNSVLSVTELFNQCNDGRRPVEWQLEVATSYDDAIEAMERFHENNIPLVIGSGIDSVSDGLNDSAAEHEIVFWDITQRPRRTPSEWSFALRPDDISLGTLTAKYIRTDVVNTILNEPLRLALIIEDTPRAIVMADAAREQLEGSIVVDETISPGFKLAVDIREADVNVLLLITITEDATDLWFDMRQADANVDAWMLLGQEELILTRRYVDDRDTTGVMIVGSQHFAVESIAQAISPEWYASFLDQYHTLTDDDPDSYDLSAAIGTYMLLSSLSPHLTTDLTSHQIREILQNTSDIEIFNTTGSTPIVVRQQQSTGYCILSPEPFMSCEAPMQRFPTWRQRVLNNQ